MTSLRRFNCPAALFVLLAVTILSGCTAPHEPPQSTFSTARTSAAGTPSLKKSALIVTPKAFSKSKTASSTSSESNSATSAQRKNTKTTASLSNSNGAKKSSPRENAKRDSGVLYHFPKDKRDEVWPYSIECQIQEGDCGDIWLVGPAVTANGKRFGKKYARIIKTQDAEKPHGRWNIIEVIADGDKITHIVNGVVVNQATDLNVQKGKILIQSEGAEVYYRKVVLIPLSR